MTEPKDSARITSAADRQEQVRVGLVVGSTRPGRKAAAVAEWVQTTAAGDHARQSETLKIQVLDLADIGLPLLDEPMPAAFGHYEQRHTTDWAAAVAPCDAFLFVTPEYNHSIPAVLKNAIDYLFAEWNHKPAGIVSYGLVGGVRAAEHLRSILLEVKSLPLSTQVPLSVFDDFSYADLTDPTSPFTVTPRDHQCAALAETLDELTSYTRAMSGLREHAEGAG